MFSSALAAGAFGSPAPAEYVVDNEDGSGPSPGVSAAIIVAGAVTNVELALDTDLAEGGLYRVRAIGVPGQDLSTSTSASDQRFRFAVSTKPTNVEPKVTDTDLLLHGRDLVWTGLDYLETPEADLATVAGPQNTMGALDRRARGGPLPWAPQYGARPRRYVDAPLPAIGTLRGDLEAQMLRDDRVESAVAELVLNPDTPEESFFEVRPKLRGGRIVDPLVVNVFV